ATFWSKSSCMLHVEPWRSNGRRATRAVPHKCDLCSRTVVDMAAGDALLRVANVNVASVRTHSDRALYSSIGLFILLYGVYASVGAASFVDASTNYTHPWWQWLVGPPVALGVIAYDRAVVGRVAVNFEALDSTDPKDLLRRRTVGLYAGRIALAL